MNRKARAITVTVEPEALTSPASSASSAPYETDTGGITACEDGVGEEVGIRDLLIDVDDERAALC